MPGDPLVRDALGRLRRLFVRGAGSQQDGHQAFVGGERAAGRRGWSLGKGAQGDLFVTAVDVSLCTSPAWCVVVKEAYSETPPWLVGLVVKRCQGALPALLHRSITRHFALGLSCRHRLCRRLCDGMTNMVDLFHCHSVRVSRPAIKQVSPIECRLFNCGFRDAGAKLIASGLADNTTLERLE